jgi:hypothetical protein
VIFGLDGNAGFVLARITRPRCEGRLELDMTRVFATVEDAEHAVLLARLEAAGARTLERA